MQKFSTMYSEMLRDSEIPDESKLRLLGSLLVIHKNYQGMKRYAEHNYFHKQCSRNGTAVDPSSLCNVISRTPTVKSSRSFSFFSKKKICIR